LAWPARRSSFQAAPDRTLPLCRYTYTPSTNRPALAAGVLDGLQQYERAEGLLGRALDIAVAAWGAGSMQQLNVMYALAQHYRWVGAEVQEVKMCVGGRVAALQVGGVTGLRGHACWWEGERTLQGMGWEGGELHP
jgi:hypothetical protein